MIARWTLACALGVLVSGCEAPASEVGQGLGLQLRVADAQLQRGGLPPDRGGPSVSQVLTPQPQVRRGEAFVELGGRLAPGGVSLLVHAVGDENHWQVAPAGFDFVVPDELLWGAQLEFSHAIAASSLPVELQAVDESGRAGPLVQTTFSLADDVPPSQLLVSLAWDAAVDLDLHVELPSGVVVGAKNTNAYEPLPGVLPPEDGATLGGYHDYDSNQHCAFDLRNRENVLWQVTPPSGRYRVYAELFSACDAAAVNFEVVAQRGEEILERAGATMYAFDARKHASGDDAPGLLLIEFEVP